MKTNMYHFSLTGRVTPRFNPLSGSRFLICLCALLGGFILPASADELADALDNTDLVWTTNGNAGWFAQTNTTHDGVDAAQSGAITHSQQSLLETPVVGPGTLMFWWKVSSEASYDYLRFRVAGVQQAAISGSIGWQEKAFYLTSGTQALQWAYSKDPSGNAGEDKAWVDQVSFTPGGTEPIIITQPTNRTVAAGGNTNFNVVVTGTPSFSYQWFFGLTNLVGATNSTLTLTNIQPGQAGGYSVVISNSYGSATSEVATLTVNVFPPTITAHPQSQLLPPGGTASFTVAATGTQPLGYQWQFNSNNVAGATNATFTLTNVQPTNAGSYRVMVSNDHGSTNSSNAVLTLSVPKTLTVTNLANSGPGTLRQLIADAVTGDTIDFAVTGTIILTNGQLTIGKYLNIAGPGATNLTVSGNNVNRVFNVTNGSVMISGLTVANGSGAGGDGGGIFNTATLTVANCAFSTNSGYWGGAIANHGALLVENCTFTGGSANSGAAIRNFATATVRNCTISGNSAVVGGGLYNGSGSFYNPSGTMTLQSCTICSNSASASFTGGGGVYNAATLHATNCIIANNSALANANVSGSISAQAYNLIGTDPKLGPLQYNRGQTKTHALQLGSPAVDNGNSIGLDTDQRGAARITDIPYLANAGNGTDIGAYEVELSQVQSGSELLVTTLDDSDDGACTFGHCSLREAISLVATSGAPAVVNVNLPGVIGLRGPLPNLEGNITIRGPGAGHLAVRRALGADYRIFTVAPGAEAVLSGLAIANGVAPADGNGGGGILNQGALRLEQCILAENLSANADGGGLANLGALTLVGCRVENNVATQRHGGGVANFGTLVLSNSVVGMNTAGQKGGGIFNMKGLIAEAITVSSNQAQLGGGIWNDENNLTVNRCTIAANQATADGGGLGNAGTGSVVIVSSTISGNHASNGQGGGLFNQGSSLVVSNSTIGANTAQFGGGISQAAGAVALRNSIVAGNNLTANGSGADCWGTIVSQDFNLIQDGSGFTISGATTRNLLGADPLLGPLADNGGPTPTHILLTGSPAIDAGHSGGITRDQRGALRPVDVQGIANAGDGADIGAFEFGQQVGPNFIVNSTDDVDDGFSTVTHCSLREAILAANGFGRLSTINFATNVTGTINLTRALPDLDSDVALEGPGANKLTVRRSGVSEYRIFTVSQGRTVRIAGLTVSGGYVHESPYYGGGIFNAGSLTVDQCVIQNNQSSGGAGIFNRGALTILKSTLNSNRVLEDLEGGGIYNRGGTVTMIGSAVLNNTSGNDLSNGGGIYNPAGTITIQDSLLSGNAAGAGVGGAIYNGSNGRMNLLNTTLAGNVAIAGGGLLNEGGDVSLAGCTISGNNAYDDDGGGLWNNGTMHVLKSTISGNSSDFGGGGIYASGTTTLTNCTITENLGFDGGGIDGTATLRNTILAGNATHTVAGHGPDCRGTLYSADYNLVQNTNGCTITGATQHNVTGLVAKLGLLANNGGATLTCALLTGSPAIDSGHNSGSAVDQRGQPRGIDNPDFPNAPGGDASDIGAFEANASVGDGLPDSWELLHFGHIGFGPDDDVDGDGVSNLAEFLAGTNPAGTTPAPRLVSPLRMGNGQFQFQLFGPVNSTNVIQASQDLSTWTPIATNVISPTGFVPITDPTATNYSRRFYRAVSQ